MAGTKKTMKRWLLAGLEITRWRMSSRNIKLKNYRCPQRVKGKWLSKSKLAAFASAMSKISHLQDAWGGKGTLPHLKWPFTPGHEFIGHVVEIGHGVRGDFKSATGSRPNKSSPCGYCRNCLEGNYWMCTNGGLYGFKYDAVWQNILSFKKGRLIIGSRRIFRWKQLF